MPPSPAFGARSRRSWISGATFLRRGSATLPPNTVRVAQRLGVRDVLSDEEVALFTRMAGNRNRLVHFYDEVSEAEL